MNSKKQSRLRRARKTRAKISELLMPRLSVHRSGRHLYAQLIAEDGQRVLAAANTLQGDVKKGLKSFCNIKAAEKIGAQIAKAAVKAGVTEVAFDRSGFKYHGKIKALADSAREAGLKF